MPNKNVIVTGAAGFLGKNITTYLIQKKYNVISVDKKKMRLISSKHKHYNLNLKNFFIKNKLKNIYAIIDLASDPRNNYYYKNPQIAQNNVINIFSVLNFIKNLKKKPILIFSSTKQIELDLASKNKGPYSISKKFCEDIINFYSKNFNFKAFIVRFSEVYSTKNNPKNKALRKFIDKCKKNENIFIDNINHNFEFVSINSINKGIAKILENKLNQRYINFYGKKINILGLFIIALAKAILCL